MKVSKPQGPLAEAKAVSQRCSAKKVFLKILQNSRKTQVSAYNFVKKENCAQHLSCKFFEIFKSTFFNRTPPAAAYAEVDRA